MLSVNIGAKITKIIVNLETDKLVQQVTLLKQIVYKGIH